MSRLEDAITEMIEESLADYDFTDDIDNGLEAYDFADEITKTIERDEFRQMVREVVIETVKDLVAEKWHRFTAPFIKFWDSIVSGYEGVPFGARF